MPAVFEHPLIVSPDDIDRLGHANNLAFLAWMQAAALAHSDAQGWPAERYEALAQGWVVRSHEIKYLMPAFAGQALVVRTWVADMKRASSTRRYKLYRTSDNQLLASAATVWVFVDFKSGQHRAIPPEVASTFEIVAQ